MAASVTITLDSLLGLERSDPTSAVAFDRALADLSAIVASAATTRVADSALSDLSAKTSTPATAVPADHAPADLTVEVT